MINTQPMEPAHISSEGVWIKEIFDTIQGEGPFAGIPATFVRFAGCNLCCDGCDTDYTSGRFFLGFDEISSVLASLPFRQLVVITGGEPYRQNLAEFCEKLKDRTVQVETNGVLFQSVDHPDFHIVCSPKIPYVHPKIFENCQNLKYVIRDFVEGDDKRFLSVGSNYGSPCEPPIGWKGQIWIQPFDCGDSKENERYINNAVRFCRLNNYRLCFQIHKVIGLP